MEKAEALATRVARIESFMVISVVTVSLLDTDVRKFAILQPRHQAVPSVRHRILFG
jgi:hypothetical protein